MTKLHEAITELLSPDPYLDAPHPDTVGAIAYLTVLMCEVSRARRRELANEPWRTMPPKEHLDHAVAHSVRAMMAKSSRTLDAETLLPDAAHAALRLAFALRCQWKGRVG